MRRSDMIKYLSLLFPKASWLNEESANAVQYNQASELLDYIEKSGMLPPKAKIKKESDGVQWEIEAYEWESE